MSIRFKILPDIKNTNSLTMHSASARQLDIENRRVGFLRFGLLSYEIRFVTSNDIEEDEVIISAEAINSLSIPLSPYYEFIAKGSEIIIGPVIGVLAAKTEASLKNNINSFSNLVYDYGSIGGAILVFSLEGVSPVDMTIRGFVFNPDAKRWEHGVYRYPSVLFKRIGMSRKWRNHFQSVIGDKIFNNYIFNKWEMHTWLSKFPEISAYLPETILYRSPGDVSAFLNDSERLYIKPISGSQGKGIMEMRKSGNAYDVRINYRGQNSQESLLNIRELRSFLRSNLKKGKYIIQKAINLVSVDDKLVDFRLFILKNQYGVWEDLGMVSRYGSTDSIVSNVSSGGSAGIGEAVLKKILGLNEYELYGLRKRMSDLALHAAQCIDKCGTDCGNLGIDIGIDYNLNIWIIEINNKDPNHTIAIDAGDRNLFYRSKLTSMLYAKKLSGFGR